MMLRIFGLSIITTIAALAVAFAYGVRSGAHTGPEALLVCGILGIIEISLSFDNAVVNAGVLGKMSAFWQRIFLTIGILIAAFGMRFLLPMVVVWSTAGLNPGQALHLALNPPAGHAKYFPDGTPSYETALNNAHPLIAAFGGMFLLLIALNFMLEEREVTWLSWFERPLAKAGRLDQLAVAIAVASLVIVAVTLTPVHERTTVLIAGALGIVSFITVQGLGEFFDTDENKGTVVQRVGMAAFMLFLYLEVLDASFSFDGVMGAFAITSDPILIMLGLGFIGAMWVRSLTVYLVRDGALAKYVYLEHGAYWAIAALSVIMLMSVSIHVNDIITGLVGVVLIVAAFTSSIIHRRNEPVGVAEGDSAIAGHVREAQMWAAAKE